MKLSFCHPKLPTQKTYRVLPALMFHSLLRKNSDKLALSEEDIDFLVKSTNEDRDVILAHYKIFLSNHPDGLITPKSFHSMLTQCFPTSTAKKLSKHIWRIYDTNQDGLIDFREFAVALHTMSFGSSEDNLSQIFRVFDIDCDGEIDHDEMKQILKDLLKVENEKVDNKSLESLARSAFSEMDENEDGFISRNEFIEACLAQKKVATMLALKIIQIFLQA